MQLSALTKIFLTLSSALLVCSCDNAAISKSGMMSPNRYDTTPIPIKIGKLYLFIPANCFDSPIETEGKDNGYDVAADMLLLASLPDFSCRTKGTKENFQTTGLSAPHISMLISTIGRGYKINEVMQNIIRGRRREGVVLHEYAKDDSREYHDIVKKRQFGEDWLGRTLPEFAQADLYYRSESTGYTLCDRPRPFAKHYIPQCEQIFPYKNVTVQLSYDLGWIRSRNQYPELVAHLLDSFEENASINGTARHRR
jgi:hypothetical protein